MFRLVQQQTQALKTRVPNQFVSASRNSLNSQLRFNSAVTLERGAADPAAKSVHADSVGSNGQYPNNDIDRNVKKVRNFRKNIKFDNFKRSSKSANYAKINALEDFLNKAYDVSSARLPKGKFSEESPILWDSLTNAVNLYKDLVLTNDINSFYAGRLAQVLHTALKVNRSQLTSMNKKPDYDSQSFHKEMTNYLCETLREFSADILAGRVSINDRGAFHILSSFKELLLYEETLNIWKSAVNSNDTSLVRTFMTPNVVGVVLPLLYENGTSFEELKELFKKSSETNTKTPMNSPLFLGMIKASLAANENEHALGLFQQMCEGNPDSGLHYSALCGAHLAFIGECKDLMIAKTFFERALTDDLPYKMSLQVSYVKEFIQNVWNQSGDFNEVADIWRKATQYYGKNVSHGVSSSLNSKFISIFFDNYVNDKNAGVEHLKELINQYNELKAIDEPFLNIILTKCTVWHDKSIIESLEKSYELYHIPKTIVTYRILLKAMGSIDVSSSEIYDRWVQLIQKADQIGQSYIANADWAALRDATVTYAQIETDQLRNENSVSSSYNPALEAANASGAFDDYNEPSDIPSSTIDDQKTTSQQANDRVLLYFQLVKRYGIYCRDSKQYSRVTTGIASSFPVAQPYLTTLKTLDVSSISVPVLRNFRTNN